MSPASRQVSDPKPRLDVGTFCTWLIPALSKNQGRFNASSLRIRSDSDRKSLVGCFPIFLWNRCIFSSSFFVGLFFWGKPSCKIFPASPCDSVYRGVSPSCCFSRQPPKSTQISWDSDKLSIAMPSTKQPSCSAQVSSVEKSVCCRMRKAIIKAEMNRECR